MKYVSLSIIAILLVSGCVQLSGIFGGDVLSISKKISEEGLKDVVVIKDATSIPRSPALPDQPVLFTFILENVDKAESARSVYVELFNAPLFKAYDQNLGPKSPLCNQGSTCQPDICGKSRPCEIFPGEQRSINFQLLAPTESEIARIKTDTELSYKATYKFKGNLLYTIPVVNQKEIEISQRQGRSIGLTEQVTHGSGPVQIDVQLFGTPYLLSGFSGTFIFNVKNKGKGNIVNSQIEARKLVIEFPRELFGASSKLTVDGRDFWVRGTDTPLRDLATADVVRGNLITGNLMENIDGITEWYLCKSTGEAGIYYYCNEPKNPVQPCLGSDMIVSSFPSQGTCEQSRSQQTEVINPFAVDLPVLSQSAPTEGPRFQCTVEASKVKCTNTKPIQLFRDETRTTLRFQISRIVDISEPFKTYLINAYVDYDYELRSSFPITIRPFEK